jgi:hypothetical protein
MTYKRMASAIGAGFLVSQILAIVIHGFILAPDYAPFYGTLLRSQEHVSWQAILLPVSHLSFISALAWIAGCLRWQGSIAVRGLQLGVLGWLTGQVPLWLLWYAEQPWPGDLVLKQLGLELAASLIIGLTISVVVGQPNTRAAASLAAASSAAR